MMWKTMSLPSALFETYSTLHPTGYQLTIIFKELNIY